MAHQILLLQQNIEKCNKFMLLLEDNVNNARYIEKEKSPKLKETTTTKVKYQKFIKI